MFFEVEPFARYSASCRTVSKRIARSTPPTEFTFFTSTIGVRSPFSKTRFTFGSQRRFPSCMLPSDTPAYATMRLSSSR